MSLIKYILKESIHGKYAYHVTRRNNWNSIKRRGLIPSVPEDFKEDYEAIYLFPSRQDAETALGQWLGDRLDEWEEENGEEYDEIVIKVDISDVNSHNIIQDVEYELAILEPIPPNKILSIEPEYR